MASRAHVAARRDEAHSKIGQIIGQDKYEAVMAHRWQHSDLILDLSAGHLAEEFMALKSELTELRGRIAALESGPKQKKSA